MQTQRAIEPFAVFSPDATTTLAYRPALAWLSERGFSARRGRFVTIDRELLRQLYPHQARHAGLGWALVVRLFELDVSLVVELSASSQSGDCAARLAALKGSSDPAVRRPESLRAFLGAESRILNFIHTPDCARTSRREAALLRGARSVAPALTASLLDSADPPVRCRQGGVSASRLVERLAGHWDPTEHRLLDASSDGDSTDPRHDSAGGIAASGDLRRALAAIGVQQGSPQFEWAVLILAARYLDHDHAGSPTATGHGRRVGDGPESSTRPPAAP